MPTLRELLKYFGVGAVITPVVAGAVDLSTQARLIEPPRVELIKPNAGLIRPAKPISMSEVSTVEMTMTLRDGTVRKATVRPYLRQGVFPASDPRISFTIGQEVSGKSPMYTRTVGELYGEVVLLP